MEHLILFSLYSFKATCHLLNRHQRVSDLMITPVHDSVPEREWLPHESQPENNIRFFHLFET